MKFKIKIAAALLLVTIMLPVMIYGSDNSYRLVVNNTEISGDIRIIDGKAYAPVDKIAEALNSEIETDNVNRTITLKTQEYSVPDIVKKVSPSVVGIIGKVKKGSNSSTLSDNLLFGTGVIIKSNGYIITNAHVVKDMEKIVVVLSNSKAYQARLKAIDNLYDLALIKIDKGLLTPATFGDMSRVEVGEPVIAIGTPLSFSLRNSATKGIISGINRSADSQFRLIQSDVAINNGNSGGPLVNMKGEVIGINSIKYIGYGVEGMSFSIPIDTVRFVISQFEKYDRVMRPYLGVNLSESLLAAYGLPTDEGLTINDIEDDSPAEAAGLQEDDCILSVDGIKVHTIIDYNECMKNYMPGDSARLEILRNGKIIMVNVVFGESE